jgi:hypothetical protein
MLGDSIELPPTQSLLEVNSLSSGGGGVRPRIFHTANTILTQMSVQGLDGAARVSTRSAPKSRPKEPPMHYVLVATHGAEICPTSNAKTRELLLQIGPQIPKIAEKVGIKILAGPYVNREHSTVAIVEASSGEDLDRFLVESRLPQWNSVRVLPSLPLEEGVKEITAQSAIF